MLMINSKQYPKYGIRQKNVLSCTLKLVTCIPMTLVTCILRLLNVVSNYIICGASLPSSFRDILVISMICVRIDALTDITAYNFHRLLTGKHRGIPVAVVLLLCEERATVIQLN